MAEKDPEEVVVSTADEDNHTDLTKVQEVVVEAIEKQEDWSSLLGELKSFSKENSLKPKEQVLTKSAPEVSVDKDEEEEVKEAPKEVVEEEEEYVELADHEDQEHTTEIHVNLAEKKEVDSEKPEKEKKIEKKKSSYKRTKRTVSITKTGSLQIKGFKRPLKLQDVKKTLRSFGKVKTFWMNNIKSECLVTFVADEDAKNCKKALDKTFFPPDQKPPTAGQLRVSRTDEKTVTFAEKNMRKDSSVSRLLQKALKESASGEQFPRRGKKRGREVGPELPKSKRTKKKRKSAKAQMAEKLVNEFFQITKSKPRIYWKPRSDEDIAKQKKQQEEKRKREEKERRQERRPPVVRGIPGHRVRSPPRRRRFSRERDTGRRRERERRGRRRSPPRRYRR